MAIAVEVDAVLPRVAEDTVQHYAYAHFFRRPAQGYERCFIPEQRVDAVVIPCVIAMVGAGFKDGIQIEDGDTQAFKVGQLVSNAIQVAAKEIRSKMVSAAGVLADHRKIVPIRMQVEVFAFAGWQTASVETIGENLVHDTIGQVSGR